ncbi:MEDS domain-containing protein [Kutzneria kofuensis]|uniref:Anti-anti-sigma regulatory factor n=1 Tax=Kutzneria kofuensis TaxID=103725 RepID=A0A7W9KSG1_9PSEU|nr:MEDS domain-containing protein [Kutzneria kofuensis]MBB5897094.1 anti-anti-sigma regulatory factor [Kutzneria kofuensis]
MVRASGTVDNALGLGLHDHVCWSYDDDAEFRSHARDFLIEGLALGQRVCYIGDDTADALAADLREVDGMDAALRRGAACVAAVRDTYRPDAVVEPAAQVATYASATEQALADGFSGLRVAADVTTMVRQPAQHDAFARYEHLVDRYMTVRPFAALCGYDRVELGKRAVAQLACMHPNTTEDATPFRLYGSADCSAELAGDLDILSAELFPLALRRAEPHPSAGRVVLDASRVDFMDHRSLMALDDHARDHGVTVVVRTDLHTPAHVIEALKLTGVRVDSAT